MSPIELMADMLVRLHGMTEWTLGDFSEADMMVRPVPAANHALWQIGHLAVETVMFASIVPGVKLETVPADWKEKFGKAASKNDDAKAFPSKAEVMKLLSAQVASLAEAIRKLKPEDLTKPGPDAFKDFAPTVGHVVEMTGAHLMMHVGQFQVIRRKLGKPVLF